MKSLVFLFLFASLTSYAGEGGGAGGGVVPSMQALVNESNELRDMVEARLLNNGTLEITDGVEILELNPNELRDIEFQIEEGFSLDGIVLTEFMKETGKESILLDIAKQD